MENLYSSINNEEKARSDSRTLRNQPQMINPLKLLKSNCLPRKAKAKALGENVLEHCPETQWVFVFLSITNIAFCRKKEKTSPFVLNFKFILSFLGLQFTTFFTQIIV